jgi:hypothetical protein
MAHMSNSPFRVLEATATQSAGIDVCDGDGNAFHLGPVLRKYTAARLNVTPGGPGKPATKSTFVEFSQLFDALGLLRSMQYDVTRFNAAAAAAATMTQSELRHACYRLSRQASAFGVRLPRAGAGVIRVDGLDELIRLVEDRYEAQIASARGMVTSGIVDFASVRFRISLSNLIYMVHYIRILLSNVLTLSHLNSWLSCLLLVLLLSIGAWPRAFLVFPLPCSLGRAIIHVASRYLVLSRHFLQH